MNALELKQKLKESDNHKTLLKIFGLSILVSLIIFPINYWFNPNIDPVVTEYPILLAFGFVAFVVMFALLIVGGLVSIMLLLDSYLLVSPRVLDSYGRFNAHSVLRDSEITNRMANGIHQTLKRLRLDDFTFQIDETRKGLQYQIDELKENDVRKDRHIARQNQEIFELKSQVTKLKNEKIEKLQTMNEKTHSTDITKNSSIDKDKKFEEDL